MNYYESHLAHLRELDAKYGYDMVSAVHARTISTRLQETWRTDAEILELVRDLDRAYCEVINT